MRSKEISSIQQAPSNYAKQEQKFYFCKVWLENLSLTAMLDKSTKARNACLPPEKNSRNLLDYPTLSCNDVNVWISTTAIWKLPTNHHSSGCLVVSGCYLPSFAIIAQNSNTAWSACTLSSYSTNDVKL